MEAQEVQKNMSNDLSTHSAEAKRRMSKRLKKRQAAEKRFQFYGMAAIFTGMMFLVILFTTIISKGWPAFLQTSIQLNVNLAPEIVDPTGERNVDKLMQANYTKIARTALYAELGGKPKDRKTRKLMYNLLSRGIDVQIRDVVVADPSLIGKTIPIWLYAHGNVDALLKGAIDRNTENSSRLVKDQQLEWIDKLVASGKMVKQFNWGLFTHPASSQPETAGLGVALIGTFFMVIIVLLLAIPIGVAAALYLEEFAPKNRVTDIIEVNINNLAAVPSIVFGLLGLAVFINFMGLPRSGSIVGGLVLALMTLPTIIIATRSALRAVSPSIREGAYGVGASKMQTIFHHILPLAFPGIMTGTIIGIVQAVGETAPLLMIGMVAFVQDFPTTPMEPATALPVQIFMWATSAERGFVERTAGATMVLLAGLFVLNAAAVYLRRKYERKW
jgi:phosphate transport system permease protein